MIKTKWMSELESFAGIKSTFVIEGNINDIYPIYPENDEKAGFKDLTACISTAFKKCSGEAYHMLPMSSHNGFTLSKMPQDAQFHINQYMGHMPNGKQESGDRKKYSEEDTRFIYYSEVINALIAGGRPKEVSRASAIIVSLSSRFVANSQHLTQAEARAFSNLYHASLNAQEVNGHRNTLVLLVDKFSDLPAWFYLNNLNLRTLTITNPDRQTRELFIMTNPFPEMFFSKHGSMKNEEETRKEQQRFIDMTDGLKILEMKSLHKLFKTSPNLDVNGLINLYKYGIKEDRWPQMFEKLQDQSETGESLMERFEEYVKGQDEAVAKTIQVLRRTAAGISGLQHSSSASKPRGVLFLSGPTGSGKTELVKTVARILFGDERAILRFDMSEYDQEHSDQKLFGAPPGYVGYESGGQLTNAVRANPFSILLFDEIEKAHDKIMDKFLQILEDGRMTDGQGKTVYFSDTLIFFTSNLGISEEGLDTETHKKVRIPLVTTSSKIEEIRESVLNAMNNKYKPEVMGRIGEDNVIVFKFIDETVARDIMEGLLDKIRLNILRDKDVKVTIDEAAKEKLFELCSTEKEREKGGRGIGNAVETHFLNPLANFFFTDRVVAGNEITSFYDAGTDGFMFRKQQLKEE